METVVCLLKAEDVHSQQMGEQFSFFIPDFHGPGHSLRICLSMEAQQALLKDMVLTNQAKAVQIAAKVKTN